MAAQAAAVGIRPPAVVVVGEVVALAAEAAELSRVLAATAVPGSGRVPQEGQAGT